MVSALGATEFGKPGFLQLVVEEGDSVYEIEEALWVPLEKKMKKLLFFIKITLCGKKVVEAEECEEV